MYADRKETYMYNNLLLKHQIRLIFHISPIMYFPNILSRSLLLICFFMCTTAINVHAQQNAQDTVVSEAVYWRTGASFGLNFSQVQLTNWAGGGQSSFAIGSLVVLEADYTKGKVFWTNYLNLAYGRIRQGNRDQRFNKTDDLLNFLSKYNYHINDGFFVTALADFRTQMDVGYEDTETGRNRISDFMAPGFLVASLGVTHLKKDLYSITLSPIASKFTFVMDERLAAAGAFGVDPGQRIRSEFGAALNAGYENEILTNVNFRTNLNLFANYTTLSRVDVNWEGTLLLKVNDYLNTTIATQLIYDHDVIQKTQWRNAINVGFLLEI